MTFINRCPFCKFTDNGENEWDFFPSSISTESLNLQFTCPNCKKISNREMEFWGKEDE